MFEISDVHLLRTIMDLGSISRAAERLNMSQPTLSKKLTRLEDKLGLALFHRSSDGAVATLAAQYVIERGSLIENQVKAVSRHVALLASLKQGHVTIGVGPIVEQLFFPAVLLDFTKATERVTVSLRVGDGAQLIDWLRCGEIDVGFGPLPETDMPDDLNVQRLITRPVVAVARAGHPVFKQEVTPSSLISFNSISPAIPQSMKRMVQHYLSDHQMDMFPSITCNNYATCKSVVLQSDYFSVGPEDLFKEELGNGTLVRLNLFPNIHWEAHCFVSPENALIPSVKRIIDLFFERATADHLAS